MTLQDFCKTNNIECIPLDRFDEKSLEIYHDGSVVIEIEDHPDVSVSDFRKIISGLKTDLNYDGSEIEGEWWWAASPVNELVEFIALFDEEGFLISGEKELEIVAPVVEKKNIWKRLFGG